MLDTPQTDTGGFELPDEFVKGSFPTIEDLKIEVTPVDLLQAIEEGTEIYAELAAGLVDHLRFFDHTLREWASELTLVLPKEIDIHTYQEVLIDLGTKMQRTNNYYSAACAMADVLTGGKALKRNDVVKAIVDTYAKRGARRPAATVIEQMADSYMSSSLSAAIAAKVVKNFWRQRLDILLEMRKILEQIGIGLSVQLKHLGE